MLTSTETPPLLPCLPHLEVPDYQCGNYGKWSLKEKVAETFERGYFTGFAAEPPGFYLMREGHIWMSTSRLERESHAIHLKHARGNVVMCGLGMGMYLYNISCNPLVDKIIAVEIDADVIELVQSATSFESWPGRDKIRFVNKDATKLTTADVGLDHVDYLYVDIWPELGNPQAVPQTKTIQAIANAATVGWWGQEIDFIEWLFHHWPKQQSPALADLVDYMDSIGLPIEEHTASYLEGCRQAATIFGSYGSLPFALSLRGKR